MNDKGFTFIEILVTLTLIAILFVPLMQIFSNTALATANSLDEITAINLAKWEMERTLNLNLSKERLREMGDAFYPDLEDEPFQLNHTKWRIQREVLEGTNPLELRISVYRDGQLEKPIVTLFTLIEDMMWTEVTPV